MLVSLVSIDTPTTSAATSLPSSESGQSTTARFHKTLKGATEAASEKVGSSDKKPVTTSRQKTTKASKKQQKNTPQDAMVLGGVLNVSSNHTLSALNEDTASVKTTQSQVTVSTMSGSRLISRSPKGVKTSKGTGVSLSKMTLAEKQPSLKSPVTIMKSTVNGVLKGASKGSVPTSSSKPAATSMTPPIEDTPSQDAAMRAKMMSETPDKKARAETVSPKKPSLDKGNASTTNSGTPSTSGSQTVTAPSGSGTPVGSSLGHVGSVVSRSRSTQVSSDPTKDATAATSKPPGWTIQSTGGSNQGGIKQSTWTIRPPLAMGPAMKMDLTQQGSNLKANLTVNSESLGMFNMSPTALPHQAVHLPEGVSTLQFSLTAQGGSSQMSGNGYTPSGGGYSGEGSAYGQSGSSSSVTDTVAGSGALLQGIDYRV